MTDVSRAVDLAARDSYGRLLSFLAARTSDISLAEDALADALTKALTDWDEKGIPKNPEAWLLTVARNRMKDAFRRRGRWEADSEVPDIASFQDRNTDLPDERLALMMVCAHPSIASDLHTPLMLQTVLGLDAATIARLFLISPTALAKRLVRAKAKIRDARIPFELPDASVLPERSLAVADAIYALHAYDWFDPSDSFGREAFFLADLLSRLLPDNSEVLGLSALIAFNHARSDARLNDGVLVPTPEQDPTLWDDELIGYGRKKLMDAFLRNQIGRFQIEAAIQEVHLDRRKTGRTDWQALDQLYHGLVAIAPSAGALVAHCVVKAEILGPETGLASLLALEEQLGMGFQPFWATRAEMLVRLGRKNDAHASLAKAISLTTSPPVIAYLRKQLSTL
jgi:RNA polymerase sigma-70 factor (ECF subfamily)